MGPMGLAMTWNGRAACRALGGRAGKTGRGSRDLLVEACVMGVYFVFPFAVGSVAWASASHEAGRGFSEGESPSTRLTTAPAGAGTGPRRIGSPVARIHRSSLPRI